MSSLLTPLVTALVGAVVTLLGAAVPLGVAWLKARTEAQRQAVLGAAHAVELTPEAPLMTGPEKKALAIKIATRRLPLNLQPAAAKAGELVEGAMPSVRAAAILRKSLPPKG